MSAENSEVSPLGSVAVALMMLPAIPDAVKLAWNVTFPLASVTTVVEPRNICPWPNPEGSAVGLAKN